MLDLLIIVLLVVFILSGYKKGFFKTVYSLVILILSTFGTRIFFPFVNKALISSGFIYEPIKNNLMSTLSLQNIVTDNTIKAQHKLISNLNLPDFIINKLNENNNFEVYKILNVSSVEEYIAGYIANIIINIFASILVFMIIFFAFKLIGFSYGIIKKLPILKDLDSLLGGAIGFLKGIMIVWIVFVFLTFFIAKYPESGVNKQLETSVIAIVMYENNIFLKMITGVFN